MNSYSIKDISVTTERHKLFVLACIPIELENNISFIINENIPVINIGKELAVFLDELEDYRYLTIDVFDFIKKLLDKNKVKINEVGNHAIAIYNLGTLLEPTLQLNVTKLLKEFSKSTSVIIIWENQIDNLDFLTWDTKKDKYFLDFSDTTIKRLHYAI